MFIVAVLPDDDNKNFSFSCDSDVRYVCGNVYRKRQKRFKKKARQLGMAGLQPVGGRFVTGAGRISMIVAVPQHSPGYPGVPPHQLNLLHERLSPFSSSRKI
jgi:hypothetical protein